MRKEFNLSDLQKKLEDQHIIYDPDRKTGVLLHCPVVGKWCGILVLAPSHNAIRDILDKLDWLTDEFVTIKGV